MQKFFYCTTLPPNVTKKGWVQSNIFQRANFCTLRYGPLDGEHEMCYAVCESKFVAALTYLLPLSFLQVKGSLPNPNVDLRAS